MHKRPLSAYNIYFKVQRFLLINDRPDIQSPDEADEILREADQVLELSKNTDTNTKRKRLHRKTHGKIGFSEMGKTIGLRWKACHVEMKRHFEKLAREEKKKQIRDIKSCRRKILHDKEEMTTLSPHITESQEIFSFNDQSRTDSENVHGSPVSVMHFDANGRSSRSRSLKLDSASISANSLPCKLKDEPIENSCAIEPLPFMPNDMNSFHRHSLDYEACAYVVAAFEHTDLNPN